MIARIPIGLKKIKNALFCIESDNISFDKLIDGEYDDELMTHIGLTSKDIKELLPHHIDYIKTQIDFENQSRKIMFG